MPNNKRMMSAAVITTTQMATRLGIDSSRVRRLAIKHNIGTKVNDRLRLFSESDIPLLKAHLPGVPGRPRKA